MCALAQPVAEQRIALMEFDYPSIPAFRLSSFEFLYSRIEIDLLFRVIFI
jgi:hypothetical protein